MPVELHLSLEFDNANLEVKSKSHLFGIKLNFQGKKWLDVEWLQSGWHCVDVSGEVSWWVGRWVGGCVGACSWANMCMHEYLWVAYEWRLEKHINKKRRFFGCVFCSLLAIHGNANVTKHHAPDCQIERQKRTRNARMVTIHIGSGHLYCASP